MIEIEGVDSKFRLVILASRRAKQLIAGARKRVDMKAENPLTVAMEEFRQGRINAEAMLEDQQQLENILSQIPDTVPSPTSALEELAAERLAAIGKEPLETEEPDDEGDEEEEEPEEEEEDESEEAEDDE